MRPLITALLIALSLGVSAPGGVWGWEQAARREVNKPPKVWFTQAEIARYAIRSIMEHADLAMRVRKAGANYVVSYTRPDGRSFAYKVRFNHNIVVWGDINGRWRDRQDDELVTYKVRGRMLTIEQVYGDGSFDQKVYIK